ncbi:MAG: RtcB family protein [Candidatus Omnitrophota bacterium]|nr:MAG: RtcB family protein [Candidatus Omnitrophota bacterium]
MQTWQGPLEKLDDYRWHIPKNYMPGMRVPGVIYADKNLLETIKRDKALQQVANAAHLPGIVKYSLAMPDIHWGYGLPIGGVVATDIEEEGVITPGGVGYDINCLAGESKVLLDNGAYIKIKDFENIFKSEKLSCINFERKKKENTPIQKFIKIKPTNHVFEIETLNGNKITITEDHPFWTPDGMIPIKNLGIGDVVAIYPFDGVPYEEPNDEIIIDENGIKKFLLSIGKDSRGHGLEQIMIRLKKRKLLPLRYNSPQLPYLLKIMGYNFGDGNIYFNKKRGKGFTTWFYGKKEDLEKIKQDIDKIGFICSRPYSRVRNHEINTMYSKAKFTSESFGCKVGASSFAALLVCLGTPLGNKTKHTFRVPDWIMKAPLWQKRLFLAGFFGAEMSSPGTLTGHGYNFYCPTISMNKQEKFINNGREFLEDISGLLKEFNISTHKISKRVGYRNKSGKDSISLRLMISNKSNNLINLYSKIGFEYNQKRSMFSNIAAQYLKVKESQIKEREFLASKSRQLVKVGLSTKSIYEELSSTVINKRFIERSVYGGRIERPRVSFDTMTFDEFLEYTTRDMDNSGMIWDRIENIRKVEFNDYVYDFTVFHEDHNFIANNFVVSNCGVRLIKTNLTEKEIKPRIKDLASALYNRIPAGVGSEGKIRVDINEERKILKDGAKWAVSKGFGTKEDLEHTEERGCMEGANPSRVSDRAYQRGKKQSGTLGSGNHFIEIQLVDEIYDEKCTEIFNIGKGQITIMIHSGSRGFGHQICDEYSKSMIGVLSKYGISVPDRQLACAPVRSPEGQAYIGAMKCAANYAWNNRQCLMHLVREVFERFFNRSFKDLGMDLIYDVAHNIAKFEKYNIDGKEKLLCVHRKGATRAFSPGHPDLPSNYKDIGQPVIIPGDMGRNSFLLVGTQKAEETFYSTCFTGDTKILTDRGIVTLKEIYEFNKLGLIYNTPSINKNTLDIEWKPILGANKRMASAIRVAVSQTNRSKFSTLDTTPDHKFSIFENADLKFEKIENIVNNQKMVCVLDKINIPWKLHYPRLAFLIGALATDGYIENKKNKRIIFTQKKTNEKLDFINYVKSSFNLIYDHELKEGKTKYGGGMIRGRVIAGSATDFVNGRKHIVDKILTIFDDLQTWVLKLNKESTFNFLASVIDGDGTWNPSRKVIDIFNSKKSVIGAIVLACLKLEILPYVSIQRGNCYIIQISEKLEEILKYTKRVKGLVYKQKYGSKLFSIRQLFTENWTSNNIKWPFNHKADRNNLMEANKILSFLSWNSSSRYNRKKIINVINSPLRMQRVKKIKDLGLKELYNIEVQDNHNYFVFTKTFVPVLVKNCHGAGRLMSRKAAISACRGRSISRELAEKGISVMAAGRGTLAEEAPEAYKNVTEVVHVVHEAGISKRVARMRPLCVLKG